MQPHEPSHPRVVLITGGAQGIGAGIAAHFARAGVNVVIADVQEQKANDLAAQLSAEGARVVAVSADVTTEEGCGHAVDVAAASFGRLDVLVNNAAPGRRREMVGAFAGDDWPDHEALVLRATARLAERAAPHLEKTRGAVVNVSSVVARAIGYDHCSWPYHVSKAGLEHLTRWLAVKLGPSGIRVNAVAPGLIDREGRRASDDPLNRRIIDATIPLRRAGTSGDVAAAVAFLSSDSASYVTGQVITVDGGLGLHDVWSAAVIGAKLQGP